MELAAAKAQALIVAQRAGIESRNIRFSSKLEWIDIDGKLALTQARKSRSGRITIFTGAFEQHDQMVPALQDCIGGGNIIARTFDESQHPRDEGGKFTFSGGADVASASEFIDARDKSSRANFLSPLKPEDLSGHTLILNKDKTVGAAIDKQGDLQNVFNNGGPKGAAANIVATAIGHGAKTLDCYDGFLPGYYRQFGFVETGRLKFNPEFAHNWSAEHGTPDVVFMAWKGYTAGGAKAAVERATSRQDWIKNERTSKYETDFDVAKAASRAAAGGKTDHRSDGDRLRSAADRAGDQSVARSGEGNRRAIDDRRGIAGVQGQSDRRSPVSDAAGGRITRPVADGARVERTHFGTDPATAILKDFDESKHPRDEHGRWTDAGGGEGGGEGEHPGHGYSKEARVDAQGRIHTSNVNDAARALYENRQVVLNQPREVSTLIDHLGQVAKHMIARGEKAPVFNLCNVTVKGTNLFCADSVGIPRVQMPQMDADQTKAFRKYLKSEGYKIEKTTEEAEYLRATQNELNGAKVAKNAQRLRDEPDKKAPRLIVSRDNYILDGHHRWAAKIGIDAQDNKLGDEKMKISRVDIDIITLLKEAEKFTGGKGHVSVETHFVLNEFDESKHPRGQPGNAGQFGPGGGGGESEPAAQKPAEQRDPADFGFSKSEMKTLNAYSKGGHKGINSFMRGDTKYLSDKQKADYTAEINTIKSAMKKSALSSPATLYRVIQGGSKTGNKLKADHNAEKLVGKNLPLGGFQSTSYDQQATLNFDDTAKVMMVFDVPAKTPAIAMEKLSDQPEEHEFLLNEGNFAVTKVVRDPGTKMVYIHGTYSASAL